MNITDDTFNKMLTIILLLYVMVMYTVSYITGKPLDLYNLLAFLAPLFNNIVHLVTRSNLQQKTIETEAQKVIAANGKVTP